ncbi:MAG: glycerol-3-phosphate dehydrogenase/oxidase [Candidatus Omnitrophota bacterium]|nr:glycerol-3-phosphate dehydrogenase/oxidase [Candidatus Omnitrophota bacterium]
MKDLEKTFDLLIIGGGIVGAGIAWDASLRGLSCALVEAGDFAGGTSSKTTKLIHGGIRYLEQLDFRLVRESLRERSILLNIAPQFIKPLPFLIPVRGGRPRPWPLVCFGVFLYDWFAGSRRIGRARFLGEKALRQEEPRLVENGYRRAALYYDAQMDDAALVMGVLQAAKRAGAVLRDHTRVTGLLQENNRIAGVKTQNGEVIQARRIINAAGPWVDQLRRLANPSAKPLVRMSKGIHLVYPNLGLKHAILVSSERDGRIFFLIPWKGNTLIGTTDTDYSGDPGLAQAEPADVEYLLEEANRALPGFGIRKEKILATFAGVRPLVAQETKDPWAVSRSHRIYEEGGLLTVVGGKFTTFRKIAEDVVDRLAGSFPDRKLVPCRTAQEKLEEAKSTLPIDNSGEHQP